eukprot:ANDGO_04045.mRNA.1 Spindle and kinetochore-associated protein 1 homolog
MSIKDISSELESKISSLKELMLWRSLESGSDALQMLRQVSAAVSEIEASVSKCQAYADDEERYLPLCEKLALAIQHQKTHIQSIKDSLPERLPGRKQAKSEAAELSERPRKVAKKDPSNERPSEASAASISQSKDAGTSSGGSSGSGGAVSMTISLLTASELESIPKYMRGRWTLEKINAAIEEINGLVAKKFTLWNTPISKIGSDEERALYHAFRESETPEVKGTVFLTDAELKQHCPSFKMDASARSLVQMLRHVARVKEVRPRGSSNVAYTIS